MKRSVRFEIILPMEFPDHLDDWDINFSLNESSWCMSNLIDMLQEYEREHGTKAYADVIVVDPPRKGCAAELLDTIDSMNPDRLVYISCDPATLARDCAILKEKGYEVQKVTPVDMFPKTSHVETVALLLRTNQPK